MSNDKNIVVYYPLEKWPGMLSDGPPKASTEYISFAFDFQGLAPGSEGRIKRVEEFDRIIESLRGQGIQPYVFNLETWYRYTGSGTRKFKLRPTLYRARHNGKESTQICWY